MRVRRCYPYVLRSFGEFPPAYERVAQVSVMEMSSAGFFVFGFMGLIGTAYLVYGWRQKLFVSSIVGVVLSVLPLAVPDPFIGGLLCAAVLPLPFFYRV